MTTPEAQNNKKHSIPRKFKNVIITTAIATMSVLSLSSCGDDTVSRKTLIKQYEDTEKYRKQYKAFWEEVERHKIEIENQKKKIEKLEMKIEEEKQGNNNKATIESYQKTINRLENIIQDLVWQIEQAEDLREKTEIHWNDAVKLYNKSRAIASGNKNPLQKDDININRINTVPWEVIELPPQPSPQDLGL